MSYIKLLSDNLRSTAIPIKKGNTILNVCGIRAFLRNHENDIWGRE